VGQLPLRKLVEKIVMNSKNIALYFTEDDYNVMRGNDWPSYQDVLDGNHTDNPFVQDAIRKCLDLKKSEGIKFPIKTATACQSKWTWSTIWLTRLASSSCHRAGAVPFELKDFNNFHNLPKKLEDRRSMLKGEWPVVGGCSYCKDIEASGGWSDRQHNNDIPGLTPDEVVNDPTAIVVSPKIVEVFAQNTCNLSCTYCNGMLSSKIEHEGKKFGHFNKGEVYIPVITSPTSATKEYFDKFIEWLDNNIQTLVRLHLLGGETFIQHELMEKVLDIIERKPNPNLELCVFSNLNVPDKYWNLYTTKIHNLQKSGNIKYFDLTASIDNWGAEAEYARFGLNLKRFEKRFAWAASQGNWLRLTVNQTVSVLTMRTMPDLINKICEYNKEKHIGHYFQYFTGSVNYQHPKIFGYDFWAEDFNRILKAMPTDTEDQREAIPRMKGLQAYLKTFNQPNWKEINNLHIYLDELDRRRGTNWRETFPYLNIQQPK